MILSRFLHFGLLNFIAMLFLTLAASTTTSATEDLFQDSCLVGTTRLFECSPLGDGSSSRASVTLQSFASSNCDYLFTVVWGPISEDIFVNGTDLIDVNDSGKSSSLSYTLLEYEYDMPGVYDLSITVTGYHNITNYHYGNLFEETGQIQVDRPDWIQLTIAPDGTCTETTHSGAMGFAMTFSIIASARSLVWLML